MVIPSAVVSAPVENSAANFEVLEVLKVRPVAVPEFSMETTFWSKAELSAVNKTSGSVAVASTFE